MAKKVGRNSQTGQFTIVKEKGETVVVEKVTGKKLPLKGYGALKGRYVVRDGIDITKPISPQSIRKGTSYRAAKPLPLMPTKKK